MENQITSKEELVVAFLKLKGIEPKNKNNPTKGYQYIKKALLLCLEDKNFLTRNRVLIMKIAEEDDSTAPLVIRCVDCVLKSANIKETLFQFLIKANVEIMHMDY